MQWNFEAKNCFGSDETVKCYWLCQMLSKCHTGSQKNYITPLPFAGLGHLHKMPVTKIDGLNLLKNRYIILLSTLAWCYTVSISIARRTYLQYLVTSTWRGCVRGATTCAPNAVKVQVLGCVRQTVNSSQSASLLETQKSKGIHSIRINCVQTVRMVAGKANGK